MDRVPSGVPGLDELIEGGFPRKNLIVISGPPGCGKTILGFQFLYEGVLKRGEIGLYVSFLENKDSFFSNFAQLGFDLDALEQTNRFKLMSLLTTKEVGVQASLTEVLQEVTANKVTLMVIDSFTAMRDAFEDPMEARLILSTVLGKMVRYFGCTTLLTVEKSAASEQQRGIGMESFVSDGVINLEAPVDHLEIRRRALISKMRGTDHSLRYQSLLIGTGGVRLAPMVG